MFNSKNKNVSLTTSITSQPISTVIGNDVILKGDISGNSTVKVDGKVEGNISVKSGIILGESAAVTGNMESSQVIIFGKLQGNIKCKDLILKSSGLITGDIVTETVEIEHGGKYNGKLSMSQSDTKSNSTTPKG